jgi:hypothetical protein
MEIKQLQSKLGRIHQPDERDKKYLIKSLLPPKQVKEMKFRYWWPSGWWGDQGNTPQCVAYSWVHWLAEGPITQKRKRAGGVAPFDPNYLYHEAQKVDEWPGEDYDGTSVRAGAKILKNAGFINSYSWAWDLDTTIQAVMFAGPVVVGTSWLYDMFFPNEKGIITASGDVMGGHAYLLDGVNIELEMFRIKNSWGRSWGKNGFAYISFSDMESLILDNGEICLSTEINVI